MKNILICVDSGFQFIIAAHLRTTVYKEDSVDLVIYNSYAIAKQLYENINENGYFDKVYFADTALTYCGNNYSLKEKLPKYFIYLKVNAQPSVL